MAKKQRNIDRLPKAPLAEVVFELRWRLPGPEDTPAVFKADPGLLPLIESFTPRMKKLGFGHYKDMGPALQTVGHSIARRYFQAADKPFPINQIGHGIFATNQSSLYDWPSFKKQTHVALRALLDCYPKLGVITLKPMYMELRYIDVFDRSLLGKAALLDFIERGTTMKIQLPAVLTDSKLYSGDAAGRMVLHRDLKGWPKSKFLMDLGSGKREGTEDVVRMETKVTCEGEGVPSLGTPAKFMKDVDRWLEHAHGLTSPFFKAFITDNVMRKFGGG